MTVSTEIATPPKSTNSRNNNFSVSRGTNSNWDFGLIWISTDESEFLDLVDSGGVAFRVETVILNTYSRRREYHQFIFMTPVYFSPRFVIITTDGLQMLLLIIVDG